jgi:hypothetical protein
MHKRLVKFDAHRMDKLKLTPFDDYEPETKIARKLKQTMTMFRSDPQFKKDLNEVRK